MDLRLRSDISGRPIAETESEDSSKVGSAIVGSTVNASRDSSSGEGEDGGSCESDNNKSLSSLHSDKDNCISAPVPEGG